MKKCVELVISKNENCILRAEDSRSRMNERHQFTTTLYWQVSMDVITPLSHRDTFLSLSFCME